MKTETFNPTTSLRERDSRYYELLAGGAKTRLLETFLDLQLPELLGAEGALSATEICQRLSLHPHRGWKFLHLLAMSGLVNEHNAEHGEDSATFSLSDQTKEYFGEDGTGGYFFRDLVNYWRNVAILPTIDVLRGMPLPEAVRWPPPGPEQADHLETWMRVTADGAIGCITSSGCVDQTRKLLDVGGGDGTIGCALTEAYPELEVAVFNLPASAFLARQNIHDRGCGERVKVVEGDFLQDELPSGYDTIMFSRVLTDWTPDVCQMLFEKSNRALESNGRLLINEALVDENLNYAISWEFRYLFYDTFGRAMFKPLKVYEALLEKAGFRIEQVSPMTDDAFYSVVEAVKI